MISPAPSLVAAPISRALICIAMAAAVLALPVALDSALTPASATSHCRIENGALVDCGSATETDCNAAGAVWNDSTSKCELPPNASVLIETFFASGLGGVLSRIFAVVGILFALVMVAKNIMEAVQGGGGLSRAMGPVVASLIIAALMMNIKGVATLIARFIMGFQSTLSAILPFM